MKRLAPILMALSLAIALAAQDEAPAIVHSEVVEITGTILRIHLSPGEGTPYLDVRTAENTTKVHLGPMRYLIEEDFNPKTGQEITVKGFRVEDYIAAIEVTLPSEKKTLRLRNDEGVPLWQGARRRNGRRGYGQQ